MSEKKRTYEAEVLSDLSLHLQKSGERKIQRGSVRRPATTYPAPTENDPAQSRDVVLKLIDYFKSLA